MLLHIDLLPSDKQSLDNDVPLRGRPGYTSNCLSCFKVEFHPFKMPRKGSLECLTFSFKFLFDCIHVLTPNVLLIEGESLCL